MVRKLVPLLVLGAVMITGPVAGAHDGNDNFADATEVGVFPFSVDTDNFDAGIELDEPTPCGDMGATIWYRWTPTESGSALADTSGSSLDTVLAVYTGAGDLEGLELLDCNDDAFGLQSQVPLTVEAGQTYYIQVGGYGWQEGPLRFNLSRGASISGTVTNEALEPLNGICVITYGEVAPDPSDPDWVVLAETGYTITDLDGTYSLILSPATHKIRFLDCDAGSYVAEWYDDASGPDTALPITLVDGTHTSDIDAVLTLGGTIGGHVENEAGNPVDSICVEAVGPNGAEVPWFGSYEFPYMAWPDEGGDYEIRGLPAGEYRVRFGSCEFGYFTPRPRPPSIESHTSLGLYEEQWYDDKPDFESANLVEVLEGLPTSAIDAVLRLRPRPDVAITHLGVRNVPTSTDAGDLPGLGYMREVTVDVENGGNAPANTRLIVTACPRTGGACETILDMRRGLDPGQAFSRRIDWNAFGMVGDVIIRARTRTFDDSDRTDNVARLNHYVLVGGTGVGVNLCRSRSVPGPFPVPGPGVETCPF